MAAPNANETFWAFIWYITHNPHKTFVSMTENDLFAATHLFQLENTDAITDALTRTTGGGWVIPDGTYTDAEYPSLSEAAGSSTLTATNTIETTDQARYPESVET